jgi:energy-coupling factor transporter ATP-binding protein EcfA2
MLQNDATSRSNKFIPPQIQTLEDTGLPRLWLQNLAIKIFYFQGFLTGIQLSDQMALPFNGVIDKIVDGLKREKMIEVKSSQIGLGESSYLYAITSLGMERAKEALDRSQYSGPAPVPLTLYMEAIKKQTRLRSNTNKDAMQRALSHLVLDEKTFSKIGPAVNSGTSIFLYGPSGNGKTSIARSIGNLNTSQEIYIPFAIFVDGQVIKVYDSGTHDCVEENSSPISNGIGDARSTFKRDPRWVKIRRPFVTVGGELTLEGLDLVYDDNNKYYEAAFQMKANGGVLLIDDFGRQLVRPRDLLNRWIVPLESRIDYLTLHTGRKIEVPFDVLVIFSTNLPPKELVDEAFLRRLRHKIYIADPSYEAYREIFKRMAAIKKVPYSDKGLSYLLQKYYIKPDRKIRSSHPRDLLDQILDISSYLNIPPSMDPNLIDRAADAYFVDL